MNPHYFKIQTPRPEWKRKLDKINPSAVNTIGIAIAVLYIMAYIIL